MCGAKFTQISLAERHTIEALLRQKTPVSQIARLLGRSRSTIYTEIKRGMCEQIVNGYWMQVYRWDAAQRISEINASKKGRAQKIGNDKDSAFALEHLIRKCHFSPYAALVVGRRMGTVKTRVCVNTIYNYIRNGTLALSSDDLPYGLRGKRKEQKEVFEQRKDSRLLAGKSISERPLDVLSREEFGHWEGDLVVSARPGKAAVLTLVERKTRWALFRLIPDKRQQSVIEALDAIERASDGRTGMFKSITWDNGVEFRNAEAIADSSLREGRRIGEVYYCHPYCSSERGTNENLNRMLRRIFPKGTNFDEVSAEDVIRTQRWVNLYPRAKFGGKSAEELWLKEIAHADIPPPN